jgi:hypothetical protein
MAVITISRQYGSGGREIAGLICDSLGYRYFDRDLMMRLGSQIGLSSDQLVDLPEDRHQVPGIVERLFGALPNPYGDPGEWALQAKLDAQQQLSVQIALEYLVGETGVLTLLATVLTAGFILYRLRQRGSLAVQLPSAV